MVKKLGDEVFERLHHSVNMLHSLQNCHDTMVMNREEVDERIFEEIGNCESFIKNFESLFLQIVDEDMRAISFAAVVNLDNREQAEELIDSINRLIERFNKMESEYIKKSESLRSAAIQFRDKIDVMRKDMEKRIKHHQKQSSDLISEISEEFGHTTAN